MGVQDERQGVCYSRSLKIRFELDSQLQTRSHFFALAFLRSRSGQASCQRSRRRLQLLGGAFR